MDKKSKIEQILFRFEKLEIDISKSLSRSEFFSFLDSFFKKKFDRNIANQLFDKTLKSENDKIKIEDFVEIWLEETNILELKSEKKYDSCSNLSENDNLIKNEKEESYKIKKEKSFEMNDMELFEKSLSVLEKDLNELSLFINEIPGSCYVYNLPSIIQKQIQITYIKKYPNINYYFSLIYTAHGIPNVIIPFFSGILASKFGIEMLTIYAGAFIALGQLVCYISSIYLNIFGIVGGFFIFGLGGELRTVAVTTILFDFFKGNEIALAQKYGIPGAFGFGFVACLFSLFISFFFLCFKKNNIDLNQKYLSFSTLMKDSIKLNSMFWCINLHNTLLTTVKYMLVLYLNIILIDMWFPINENSDLYNSQEKASVQISILFWAPTLSLTLIGILIDKYGNRIHLMLLSSVLKILGMTLIFFAFPTIPLGLIGVSSAIFLAVTSPTIAYVVPPANLITALGINQSMKTIGVSIFPIIISTINSYFKNTSYVLYK